MTKMLGCNIRPGTTPGGFSSPIGGGRHVPRPKRVPTETIREAARQFLIARGVVTCSTDFDCRSEQRTVEIGAPVDKP